MKYLWLILLFLLGRSPGQNSQPTDLPQPLQPDPYNCPPDTIIEIPDKSEFYPRLIAHFGKSVGDLITCADLQSLTEFGGMSGGTIDLTGIEYAINLTSLSFANVPIKSLTPLKGLKKLTFLGSYVDAIPLPGGFDCDEGGFRSIEGL